MQPTSSKLLLALLCAAALVASAAAPSWALDDPRGSDRFPSQVLPAHLLPQPSAFSAPSDAVQRSALGLPIAATGFAGLGERLLSLPLRPVVLGETPRTPSDAEQGLGVVLRIPLSL
ncbi:MAG: hypothetical protein P8Q97_07925 [Myxococcota bacterium]|jgi:hypothetical protein|nr:hypothetical protein [Myxococcota bacterium]